MNRVWLLTWTTYGTWLPGDERGFVSNVRDGEGPEVKHNIPGTSYDEKQRGLAIAAQEQMRGKPIWLSVELAEALARQLRETAAYRGWDLLAVAIMANHVHVVVRVPGDPEPEVLLRDFKSYGSRALNQLVGKPASGTWWTASGSRRKLPDERAVQAAVRYVKNQHRPLLVWVCEENGEPAASAAGFEEPIGEPAASAAGFEKPIGEPAASAAGFEKPIGEPPIPPSNQNPAADAAGSPENT